MDKSIIITETDIVKRFDEMCAESLNPDQYSFLVEEIVPQLQRVREALKEVK